MTKWIAIFATIASCAWGQLDLNNTPYVSMTSQDLPTSGWSILYWVKVDAWNCPGGVWAPALGGFTGTKDYVFHKNTKTLQVYCDGAASDIGNTALTLDEWAHIGLVYDGTYYLVYLNGEWQASSADRAGNTFTISKLAAGYSSAYVLDGAMDAPSIYTTVITSNQVAYAAWERCLRYGADAISTNATVTAMMERWDTSPANTNCTLAADFEFVGYADGQSLTNGHPITDRSTAGNTLTTSGTPTKETP